mmetsp:Transcript_46749/g.149269  ORF Transcript_46749/g.149269 Transcript_46749/m.149269 type:complete len:271 (+) Transcript_46749:557-1369(+)
MRGAPLAPRLIPWFIGGQCPSALPPEPGVESAPTHAGSSDWSLARPDIGLRSSGTMLVTLVCAWILFTSKRPLLPSAAPCPSSIVANARSNTASEKYAVPAWRSGRDGCKASTSVCNWPATVPTAGLGAPSMASEASELFISPSLLQPHSELAMLSKTPASEAFAFKGEVAPFWGAASTSAPPGPSSAWQDRSVERLSSALAPPCSATVVSCCGLPACSGCEPLPPGAAPRPAPRAATTSGTRTPRLLPGCVGTSPPSLPKAFTTPGLLI